MPMAMPPLSQCGQRIELLADRSTTGRARPRDAAIAVAPDRPAGALVGRRADAVDERSGAVRTAQPGGEVEVCCSNCGQMRCQPRAKERRDLASTVSLTGTFSERRPGGQMPKAGGLAHCHRRRRPRPGRPAEMAGPLIAVSCGVGLDPATSSPVRCGNAFASSRRSSFP